MFYHIEGKITDIVPTHVVVDCQGVGYLLHISLQTYSKLLETDAKHHKLLVHLVVREDAMLLFGFYDENERMLFKHLISVSGVGPNTARMILSSLQAGEIYDAIVSKNSGVLQSVKGIGIKTSQRIIVELHDKLGKEHIVEEFFASSHNTTKQESLSALIVLGFSKTQTEKILDKLIAENPNYTVEELIRNALRIL